MGFVSSIIVDRCIGCLVFLMEIWGLWGLQRALPVEHSHLFPREMGFRFELSCVEIRQIPWIDEDTHQEPQSTGTGSAGPVQKAQTLPR